MCKKSESITHLAVSLAKFNANVQRIEKDATNPHFKNRYASLDSILDEVRPLLAEQGLSVIQMPSGDADQLKLTTMLVHTSGEWIESDPIVMRPTKNDPQGIGSASTYARRYSLCAFLGLSTGDIDDDGNSVSTVSQGQQNAPKPQTNQQPSKPPQSSTGATGAAIAHPLSPAQVGLIKKLLLEKKISDTKYREILDGYGVEKSTDLSKSQASKLIEQLTAYVVEEQEVPLPF